MFISFVHQTLPSRIQKEVDLLDQFEEPSGVLLNGCLGAKRYSTLCCGTPIGRINAV
jgi:hypothetical protein